ncbi:MAG TPA: hypothetical protein VGK54_15040, partial [Chloroflexota bacterium]
SELDSLDQVLDETSSTGQPTHPVQEQHDPDPLDAAFMKGDLYLDAYTWWQVSTEIHPNSVSN